MSGTRVPMECSIRAAGYPSAATSGPTDSPNKTMLHVNFDSDSDELNDRKKKYLTAKYGQHQMNLIKKRLRVEMWMYEQLQALYGCTDDSQSYEIEIDVDELLDIEDDANKKRWLRSKLLNTKQGSEHVERFISELLQRAKTL